MKNTNKIISIISNIRDEANNLILNELRKNSITGLAPSHGAILNALLNSKQGLKMNDIADLIHKDKSTVTALINKLVKLEYCQRVKSIEDSRITYISLTSTGLELKPIFDNVSNKLLETTYLGFNKLEKENLISRLEIIEKNLKG